ncbi:hypothetical protein OM788_001687 [Streptomyces sp. KA12]|uniref:hypothetical protein n=1 Tax=Streptomyces sp. KA12 TaxID=2991730 RepID=UPI0023B07A08|nr:hypothetical protein [Streptomyces sp. KA12]MDF0371854.1 hypothetical protein [Streptomyces sp. KA12]
MHGLTAMSGRTSAAALLCGLSLLAAGCSGGREYTLPKDLCGVPVSEKSISPLLPEGKKLVVQGDPLVDMSGMCFVAVDSRKGVVVGAEKTDRFYDPMGELVEYKFTNRKKMDPLPFDGAGAMGDTNFVISAPCGTPDVPHLTVSVSVGDRAEEDVDRRRAGMEAFALAFVPSVKKELACTA